MAVKKKKVKLVKGKASLVRGEGEQYSPDVKGGNKEVVSSSRKVNAKPSVSTGQEPKGKAGIPENMLTSKKVLYPEASEDESFITGQTARKILEAQNESLAKNLVEKQTEGIMGKKKKRKVKTTGI